MRSAILDEDCAMKIFREAFIELKSEGILSGWLLSSKIILIENQPYQPIMEWHWCEELENYLDSIMWFEIPEDDEQFYKKSARNMRIYNLCCLSVTALAFISEEDREKKQLLKEELSWLYQRIIEVPENESETLRLSQRKKAKHPRTRNDERLAAAWFKKNGSLDMSGYEFFRNLQICGIKTTLSTTDKWLRKFKDKIFH